MENKVHNWVNTVGIFVIAAVVIFGMVGGNTNQNQNNKSVAGVTNYDSIETEGLAVGDGCDNEGNTCVGTTHTKFISGTCNLSQKSPGSHAASSSKQYYCAVSGVTAGDKVFASLPAGAGINADGAGSTWGGFTINNAQATSSDFIQVSLMNYTGAATSTFPQATTSVQYWVLDN